MGYLRKPIRMEAVLEMASGIFKSTDERKRSRHV